jgi:hypothetical protein
VKIKQYIKRPWWYTALRGMHYSAYRFWWLYLVLFFAFLFVWYLFCLLPYCENKSQCGSVKDYQVKVQEAASALKACCNGAQEVAIDDNQIDELRRSYGGSTGEVTVTLAWQTTDDLDLQLIEPDGNRIYFENKISNLGGQLDVDTNVREKTTQPLENIFYAVKPKAGKYNVIVSYYKSNSGNSNIPYVVYIKIDDQLKTLTGVHYNAGESHSIYEFIIP